MCAHVWYCSGVALLAITVIGLFPITVHPMLMTSVANIMSTLCYKSFFIQSISAISP